MIINKMEEELRDIGLSDNEVKIYLALLKEKSGNASFLAKKANLNRTTAYLELDNLMKKGLVSYVIKDSKRYYQAVNPKRLINILDEKREKIKLILPKLMSFEQSNDKFNIKIYEGREGIKTFYQDILNTGVKEFIAFGVTGNAVEIMEFSYPHFLKKFVKAGIKERAIANHNSRSIMDRHPRKFVKVKYLSEKYKSDVTTVIYGNKIAVQSLVKDKIYVIVIEDKDLAKSYKSYFEFMWDSIDNKD